MGRTFKRLVTRAVLAVAAVAVAYSGWKWGHAIFPWAEERLGIGHDETAGLPVAPETAARAAARIREFRVSEEPELRLESAEVSSLLRYSTPGMLPGGVVEPSVSFAEERVELRAGVLPDEIPELARLGGVGGLLPDTVEVLVVGSLLPSSEEGTLLLIAGVELQGWPVPPSSLPEILAALGHEVPPGAPGSAVLLPAFGGLKGAHIEDGGLVLVRVRQPAETPGGSARTRRGVSPRTVDRTALPARRLSDLGARAASSTDCWQPADKIPPAFDRRCIRAGRFASPVHAVKHTLHYVMFAIHFATPRLRSALLLGRIALLFPLRRALPARRLSDLGARAASSTDCWG